MEVDQRVALTATWCCWAEEPCLDQPWLPAPMWAEAFWQLTTWYCCCKHGTVAQMILLQTWYCCKDDSAAAQMALLHMVLLLHR